MNNLIFRLVFIPQNRQIRPPVKKIPPLPCLWLPSSIRNLAVSRAARKVSVSPTRFAGRKADRLGPIVTFKGSSVARVSFAVVKQKIHNIRQRVYIVLRALIIQRARISCSRVPTSWFYENP